MLQQRSKIPHATTKTWCSQIKKYFKKIERELVGGLVAQSCPTLCDPTDCSLPGSSVHGIYQARIPKWIVISFSRGSSRPRDRTWVSRIVGRFADSLLTKPPGKLERAEDTGVISLGHTPEHSQTSRCPCLPPPIPPLQGPTIIVSYKSSYPEAPSTILHNHLRIVTQSHTVGKQRAQHASSETCHSLTASLNMRRRSQVENTLMGVLPRKGFFERGPSTLPFLFAF